MSGHVIHKTGGTQMLAATASGTAAATNIEDITAGDLVWSRNEHTGEEGFKPVVQLFRNTSDTLVHLSYTTSAGSATLTGTPEHPFWSVNRGGWVAMGDLFSGEQLLLCGGTTATVASARTELLSRPVTVYNFEVADWHTYHVCCADTGWVFVHNMCGGRGPVLRGARGEAKVRSKCDIGDKPGVPIEAPSGNRRIPDGVTKQAISEVKNTKSVGLTRQIRDEMDIATAQGKRFDLYVRNGTHLSQPLKAALKAGKWKPRKIP